MKKLAIKSMHIFFATLIFGGISNSIFANSVSEGRSDSGVSAEEYVCNVDGVLQTVFSLKRCKQANFSKMEKFIDEQKISANLNLFNLDIADAITFGLKYKYKVNPNKANEYFTRIDRYISKNKVTPGDVFEDMPIYIGMEQNTEILFAQQFESGPEARKPLNGYSPIHMPLTAKKALDLKIGDYVKFHANLNLMANFNQVWPMTGDLLQLQGTIGFLVSGQYQVHVYRLNDDKIRLKLVGLRSKSKKFSTKLGSSKKLKILGIKLLDKEIIKLTDIDKWISFKRKVSTDDLLVMDYTLDLSDDRVKVAYNEVFNSVKGLRSYKIANPIQNNEDLKDLLISNVSELDEMSQDQMLIVNDEEKSVVRNFKGSNLPESITRKFNFGILAYKVESAVTYRDNFLTSVKNDGSEDLEYFVYPSWTRTKDTDQGIIARLFGIADGEDERVQVTSNAIFIANDKAEPVDFKNIAFSFNYEDMSMNPNEFSPVFEHIQDILPTRADRELLKVKLQEGGWLNTQDADRTNIQLDYFFHEKALERLMKPIYGPDAQKLSDLSTLKYEFLNYMDRLGDYDKSYEKNKAALGKDRIKGLSILIGNKLKRLKHLSVALDSSSNSPEDKKMRLEEFTKLRKSSLFKKYGPGFLLHLLSKSVDNNELKELVYISVDFIAQNKFRVNHQFGVNEERPYYDVIRFIDFVLNDDSESIQHWEAIQNMLEKTQVIEL